MGWPDRDDEIKRYFPTSLLVTAFDIIFFWVSRMIFSSLHFMNRIPFEKVYYHGLIRDKQGRKMSKSLNNVVDPAVIIEKYGADALRFTLTQQSSSSGQDIHFDENKMLSSRNFINKIWNATKLIKDLIQEDPLENKFMAEITIWDKWIQEKFHETVNSLRNCFDHYRFNEAAQEVYSFFWDHFCDWYLEVSKLQPNKELLKEMFGEILKILHPFIPFVTEHIWLSFSENNGKSIMMSKFPEETVKKGNDIQEKVALVQNVIRSIRNLKSEFSLSSPDGLSMKVWCSDANEKVLLEKEMDTIIKLARIEDISFINERASKSIQQVTSSTIQVFLPLQANIDLQKEIQMKKLKLEKNKTEIMKMEQKLNNPDFKVHAPSELVDGYQQQLSEMKHQEVVILDRITELTSLLS
jgi:valyl-tRNA synthetase